MRAFSGFPDAPASTRLPTLWLRAVLVEAESLAEIKVTLQAMRLLDAKRDYPRFVRVSELRSDPVTMASLQAAGGLSPEAALEEGVRLSVARGVWLALPIVVGPSGAGVVDGLGGGALPLATTSARSETDVCLFVNTPRHQQLVGRVARGEVRLPLGPAAPLAVLPVRRTTIFELYEQNIGLLTPLLAEELREAAETYPPEWVEEAFREAVGYNRRSWRYVRRILEKWATQGRADGGAAGGRPQAPRDPRRYLEGKYGHLIQH